MPWMHPGVHVNTLQLSDFVGPFIIVTCERHRPLSLKIQFLADQYGRLVRLEMRVGIREDGPSL